MAIHPTAVIDPSAQIGTNVSIGPYSVIERDVVIGDGCQIDANVKIGHNTTIGSGCRIYFGAFVGGDPQDHRFQEGIHSSTTIGSDTVIREYVTIHRSPFEGGETRIGSHTLLMAFVHVGHDGRVGDYVTCANHTALSGHVVVEDHAVLSGYIMIHQFCRIGYLAMLSPGGKIRQDVPPFCMLSEKSCVCGCNIVGMRRLGLAPETRTAIRRAVKTFFFHGFNSTNAVAEIRKGGLIPETQRFVEFVQSTERGIVDPDPELLTIGLHRNLEEDEE